MDAATPSRSPAPGRPGGGGWTDSVDLLAVYAPEPNALARRALAFLEGDPPEGTVPIGEGERRRLDRLQRRLVLIGVASGTVSGLLLGGTEIWVGLGIIGDTDRSVIDDPVPWALFYVGVGIVTIVEMLFLYWVALRAVAGVRRTVGVPGGNDGLAELTRAALARAALESPNPEGQILGIDPHAFEPRWQLLARNLVYKAKVGVTSFLLRIAMRHLLVRAVLRSYVPLLAAPLYAAWNAWILHRIMEEARIRVFGPFAVREVLDGLARRSDTPGVAHVAVPAVIELVRRGGDGHPNYILLLHGLTELYGIEEGDLAPAQDRGRAAFEALGADARRAASDVLLSVAVLAGRPSRRQLAFLIEAHGWMRLPFPSDRLGDLRKALRDGDGLSSIWETRSAGEEAHVSMQLETGERLPTP